MALDCFEECCHHPWMIFAIKVSEVRQFNSHIPIENENILPIKQDVKSDDLEKKTEKMEVRPCSTARFNL